MNCKNCAFLLTPNDNYCPNCGGKVIRNRLTIKNLLEHFSEQFLNYDNKFLQTFIHLFTKPEIVIEEYINGTRKKYVNVISYFAIAITVSGLYLVVINKLFPEVMKLPGFMQSPGQAEFQSKNMAFVQEYQSLLMMLYIPFYALMAKLVFIGFKKYNFTELIVIFMYSQSQMAIFIAIGTIIIMAFGINFFITTLISIPIMIIYTGFCLYRLYKLNFQEMILRSLIFLIVLVLACVLYIIILTLIMYLSGDLQAILEAQKAAREATGN